MGNVANITSGPSNLFVKVYDGTFPAFSGAAADFTGFTNPGLTADGIEWDYSPTFTDWKCDEKLAPVKKRLTSHKLVVTAKLAEVTLQNLYFAIAGAVLPSADELTIGSPIDAPEFTVGWLGQAPAATGSVILGTREAIMYRCVSMSPSKVKYDRKNYAEITLQMEALSESGQPNASDLCDVKDFASIPFVLS